MKLVSITSGRNEDNNLKNDMDFQPVDLMTFALAKDLTSFAQELRVVSDREDSRLQWLGGLFLLSETDDREYGNWMNFMNMAMGMPGETLALKSSTDTTGAALFGQMTYEVTGSLDITLGLRYEREQKDFDYHRLPAGPVLTMMGYAPVSGTADDTFDAWLPKAALSYRLTDKIMPYFTVARGFRSGGFNDTEQLGVPFKPEYTWNYELAAKTFWLDNALQVNNVYDGNQVIDSPEYTLNLNAIYRCTNGFFLNLGYRHFGEICFDTANTESQGEYGILDAKIGYEHRNMDLYLYAKNILDKEYATRAFEVSQAWYGRAGAPATFGVILRSRF